MAAPPASALVLPADARPPWAPPLNHLKVASSMGTTSCSSRVPPLRHAGGEFVRALRRYEKVPSHADNILLLSPYSSLPRQPAPSSGLLSSAQAAASRARPTVG
ncbi:hypothetical protein ACP70R_031151 [Stipagrostis hirtigluma subsp. patula]